MGKKEKLLEKLPEGKSDQSFPFQDLGLIVQHMGYTHTRTGSSHRVFRRKGAPIIVIQPGPDGKAKDYQVKQVREILKNLKGINL